MDLFQLEWNGDVVQDKRDESYTPLMMNWYVTYAINELTLKK